MEVIKALKDIKEYCKGVSVKDCHSRKCEIWQILGDCIFSINPECWELDNIDNK